MYITRHPIVPVLCEEQYNRNSEKYTGAFYSQIMWENSELNAKVKQKRIEIMGILRKHDLNGFEM